MKHRRVETPGAKTHVVRTCSSATSPFTLSLVRQKTRNLPLCGWSSCIVHVHDSECNAMCNEHHSLQTIFSNCTFRYGCAERGRNWCVGKLSSRKNDVPSGGSDGSRSLSSEPGPRATSSSFSGAGHASRENLRKGCHRQNRKLRVSFPFQLVLDRVFVG